jgi:hypothetical protein
VIDYRVTEWPLPDTLSIIFLFTAAAAARALPCLRWKRPDDLWAGVFYTGDTPPKAPAVRCTPRFQFSDDAIAADWEHVPAAADCADLWHSIAAGVSIDTKPLTGQRRLIVFSDPASRPPADDELVKAVAAAQAFVQVISSGPDPVLEDFCRRVNGVFYCGGEDPSIQAYLNLFARYEVVYQPLKPDAKCLKIRLHGLNLCGEAALLISSPSPAGP